MRRQIASYQSQEDFQAIIKLAARRKKLDWEEVVALLHMVYGWMPTMLRTIEPHTPAQRLQILDHLKKVRAGKLLSAAELSDVKNFANRSAVGASKLLHVLNPSNYAIWDSRVANAFLWNGVTHGTFSKLERYLDYIEELRDWAKNTDVIHECKVLRQLNPALADSGDLRLIELVLFCK